MYRQCLSIAEGQHALFYVFHVLSVPSPRLFAQRDFLACEIPPGDRFRGPRWSDLVVALDGWDVREVVVDLVEM